MYPDSSVAIFESNDGSVRVLDDSVEEVDMVDRQEKNTCWNQHKVEIDDYFSRKHLVKLSGATRDLASEILTLNP